MSEFILVSGIGLLVVSQLAYIAFAIGKSYGYQQARNEDAAILLGKPEVKNVANINEMADHLAKTLMSDETLDKKTLYIVRPSDAYAVRKLLKERKCCENNTGKSNN